ncbi:hypothetical protein CAPTEDRAFT_193890 [Capitella teleta]|uniref:Uncharacterized protein n=1 Tax=Capitella teleta TaxID=283909 RepID=R7UYS1_CAPTE|nr:hypothetical protein CAPTEDRAFT_193890 [Capitella teleta]|eukprot:ELU11484.1 hypothetical protein CAPTEDRAFT_193890 [Capitella teleta]
MEAVQKRHHHQNVRHWHRTAVKNTSPLELRGKPCNVGYFPPSTADMLSPNVSWGTLKNITGRATTADSIPTWKLMHTAASRLQWIDDRTIYNLREQSLLSEHELPPLTRPLTCDPVNGGSIHGDRGRELSYVVDAFTDHKSKEHAESRRFSCHTIKDYTHSLPLLKRAPAYGIPASEDNVRPPKLADVVRSMMKSKSGARLHPSSFRGDRCQQTDAARCQFCEVLGPVTCHSCIELSNRRAARDAEVRVLDDVQCTTTALVAPKLAQLLSGFNEARCSRHADEKQMSLPKITCTPSPDEGACNPKWAKVRFALQKALTKETEKLME